MSARSPITTHVLDTQRGQPAAGVDVKLEQQDADGNWRALAAGTTNSDGRIDDIIAPEQLALGAHRIQFETGRYFGDQGAATFFPQVTVEFRVDDANRHYHVPLLLSPYAYSTYRGS